MSVFKFTVSFYLLALIGLFLYSFTQIDLSLTFTKFEPLQKFFQSFQYIGYFNRPLSTTLYISLVILFFFCYLMFLRLAATKKLSKSNVWQLLLATTLILAFSYNAFSYDLFNYIFDAKIFTHYQQNPYLHKALDFPGDPMLSFMRWTHRVYPYGPAWLGITVPLSYLGFGFFLPTFFLFKSLMAASFLGSLYFIGKILKKIAPEKEVLGLVFFGLNPLIVIESLVSGHLDIVMMVFAVWAFYLLLQKRFIWSLIVLGLSIGIKFATVFLLPIFIAKKVSLNNLLLFVVCLLLLTVIIATLRTNFQPWYLIPPLTFAAFLCSRYYVLIPSLVLSFFALFLYVPYLYVGNWDPPIPMILVSLQSIAVITAIVSILLYKLFYQTR